MSIKIVKNQKGRWGRERGAGSWLCRLSKGFPLILPPPVNPPQSKIAHRTSPRSSRRALFCSSAGSAWLVWLPPGNQCETLWLNSVETGVPVCRSSRGTSSGSLKFRRLKVITGPKSGQVVPNPAITRMIAGVSPQRAPASDRFRAG